MSDFQKRDNSGALFKNEKKLEAGANPKLPDYRGDITIAGQSYELSAWIKTMRNGKKMMSLSAKPKGSSIPQGFEPAPEKPAEPLITDDDVPY